MVDIAKHIEYWRDGAKEDWDVAVKLVNDGKTRHGLFFAHLALEKALKSHVCRNTKDIAPKIHGLARLAELSGVALNTERKKTLAAMNEFHIEGRYPETIAPTPDTKQAREYIARAEEVFLWLIHQL